MSNTVSLIPPQRNLPSLSLAVYSDLIASQSFLGCGSILTPRVCGEEQGEVVDVEEDKIGIVSWGDVGEDELETDVKGNEDKVEFFK